MNIAILLTGHYRSATQTYESFHRVFDYLQPRIFCHTWKHKSHTNKCWWSKNGDGDKALKIITPDNFHYYKPNKLQIDVQPEYKSDNPLYNEVGGFSAVHGQWDSVSRAYNLMLEYERENNMQFDVIIKTRYDLFYNNDRFNVNEIKDIYKNPNTIYTINSPHAADYKILHDSFIVTSRNIFVKIVDNFPKIMDKYFDVPIKKHKVIEGEYPLTLFLAENKNFNCQMKYSDLKLHIIRLSGERIPLFR